MSGGERSRQPAVPGALTAVFRRGAATAAGVNLTSALVGVGVQLALAGTLGPEAYGAYATGAALVNLTSVAGRLSLETLDTRLVARYRAAGRPRRVAELVRWSSRTALATSTALAAAVLIALLVAGGRLEATMLRTLMLALAVVPVSSWVAVRCGALLGARRVAAARLPPNAGRPLGTLLLVLALRAAVGGVSAPMAMGCHLAAVLAVAVLVRTLAPIPAEVGKGAERPRPRRRRRWLRATLPHAVVASSRLLLGAVDIVLVGLLVGPAAAGAYAVASKLAQSVTVGLVAANAILAPLVSELHSRRDRDGLRRVVAMAGRTAGLAALAVIVLLAVLGAPLLARVGVDVGIALPVLGLLATGNLVNVATGSVGLLLTMTGLEHVNARIMSWSAALAVVAYPLAALWLGAVGVAAAAATLTAVQNLLTRRVVRGALGIEPSIVAGGGS